MSNLTSILFAVHITFLASCGSANVPSTIAPQHETTEKKTLLENMLLGCKIVCLMQDSCVLFTAYHMSFIKTIIM